MADHIIKKRRHKFSLFLLPLLVSSLLVLRLDSSSWAPNLADAAAVPNPNTETKLRRIQFSQAELNAAATLRAAQRPQAPRRGGGTAQSAQRERTEAPTELRVPLNGAAMSIASLSEMLLVRPRGVAQAQPAAKQSSAEADGYAPCPQFQPWKGALSRISACKWRRPESALPASASSPSVALRLFMIDFLEDKRGRAVENECRDRRWIWPRPLVTGGEVCVDEADELQVDGDDLNDDDNNEEELPELVGAAELMKRVREALGQRRGEQRSRLEANEADEVGEVGALGGGGVLRFDDVFVNSKGTVFNESHVFAVDACGQGQWNRQGGAVKALKDSISFAPRTRVSVHEHLVNLLPYEQEEAEQQAEEAEEAEMAERGLRGTDWVAQARLHNGKERLLARLLPALYLVATALMPGARQYPLLLRSEHLLEHLGRSMFGVELASLSVHHLPASRQHGDGHRHLFYAKTLFMPVHASSVCGLSSSGRPRAPDALWLALRGHHLLPPQGLPILSPDWTPRLPASAQTQSAPPTAHPLHHLAVGQTLPEDWVVVVSLVWSAHVMDRGGGGVGDGNMRTAATRHTEEAMEAIAGMLRELYSEERVVVYEEHLPLRKAKALFSRTILLVGPTSPALSNLIFMPFNSTVIEILPYVVNGSSDSSKSKAGDPRPEGKSGGKLSSQQSTATWHYRLSERVGVHHLLSVCDPERNHMDESEMCHVDEVYATVTASLRKNPVLREATGLPPVTFPPDDVSRLGDFRDFIPGSRLRKGAGQVAEFRQWAECVAERGEWRFNATPRPAESAEPGSTGGRRRNGRRKPAQHGEQAELREQRDQREGDQREGDAQDPRGERERTGAAAALEAAVEGSSLAVLPLADLIRAPRSAQQLEWQRAQQQRAQQQQAQQQQQQAGGRAAAATPSPGVCPDFQPWGFFSPDAASPHIHACAWRPMAADGTPTAALPVSQSSESSKSNAVLAALSAFMQQFLADRASSGRGGAEGGGSGSARESSAAAMGGRSVAVQQDCQHWKWLWPRPLVTRGEMCLDEDEVREFVEEGLRAEQERQRKEMEKQREKQGLVKQGLVTDEIFGKEGLELDVEEVVRRTQQAIDFIEAERGAQVVSGEREEEKRKEKGEEVEEEGVEVGMGGEMGGVVGQGGVVLLRDVFVDGRGVVFNASHVFSLHGACVGMRGGGRKRQLAAALKLKKVRGPRKAQCEIERGAQCGVERTGGLRSGGLRSGGLRSGGLRSGGLRSVGLQSGGLQSGGLLSGGLQSGGLQSGGLQSGGLQSGGLQSGTPVSVHEHLVNLLPYEHEQEGEEEGGGKGSGGGEWVAQARVHSGGTRGLVRLLPVLFLLASSLMPTARRFPILLNHRHQQQRLTSAFLSFLPPPLFPILSSRLPINQLLSHLGPDVFGVDLAPLAIHRPSALLHGAYSSSSSSSDGSYNDPDTGPDPTAATATGMPPHLFFARTLLLPIHTPSLCGLSSPPLTALHSSPPRAPDALWLALRGYHLLPPHGLPILSPDWTPRLPAPLQMSAPEKAPEDSPEVSPIDSPDGLVVGRALPEDWVVVVSVVWSTHVMEGGGGGGGEGVRETEAAMHVIIAMLKELFSDGRVIVYDEHMPLLQVLSPSLSFFIFFLPVFLTLPRPTPPAAKALFSRAILLVGPTSPALTNLLFMPFNSTLIELLPYPVTRPRSSLPLSLLLRSPYHKKAAAESALIGQPSAATWHCQLAERLGIRHYLSVCDPTWLDKNTGEQCHVDEVYATVLATVRRNPTLLALTGIPAISFPPNAFQPTPEPPIETSLGIGAKPSDFAEGARRFGDFLESSLIPNQGSRFGNFSDFIPGSRLRKRTGEVADFRRWAACVAERGEWRFNATPRVLPWAERGFDNCDLVHVRDKGGLAGAAADAVALVREMGREEWEQAWKVRDALKYQWGVAKERCPRVVRAKLGARAQAVPGSEVSEPDELFSRFDGRALCELARQRFGGLRIAFVGDSLTREAHISFVHSIVTHVRKPASVVTREDSAGWVAQMIRKKGDFYTRSTYRFDDVDDGGCGKLVVHYIANRRLVPVWEEKRDRVRWISTPWMESEEIKGAHVVVLNRGAHFKSTGHVVLSVSRALQFLRYNYPEKLIVYRATAPGHLNCKDYNKPLFKRQNGSDLPFHWGEFKVQNDAVRPVVEAMGGVFMDVDPLSALRPDGHRGLVEKMDCLHYCLPGPEDTWSEFLYNIVQRLVPVK
ncbi:unnamed protein product [Closterium sp. Naga37s-1]|nr:unnamed protein product [Closterium sp. Naga37s-1]